MRSALEMELQILRRIHQDRTRNTSLGRIGPKANHKIPQNFFHSEQIRIPSPRATRNQTRRGVGLPKSQRRAFLQHQHSDTPFLAAFCKRWGETRTCLSQPIASSRAEPARDGNFMDEAVSTAVRPRSWDLLSSIFAKRSSSSGRTYRRSARPT